MTARELQRPGWSQLSLGLVAVAVVVAFVVPHLADRGGDPASFLFIGSESVAYPCLRDDFDDPPVADHPGHDGQFNYVIARDLPAVDATAACLDWAPYRWRRILFPLLASPFGSGDALALGMVAINLAAVAAATVALARLARAVDAPTWAALGFAVSPGIVVSVAFDIADPLAYALALVGVVAWRDRRVAWAVAAFTLAALTRETTLLAPAACALAVLARPHTGGLARRVRAAAPLAVPFAGFALWAAVVAAVVPPGRSKSAPVLSLPFEAFLQDGLTSASTLLGTALIVGSLRAAWLLRRRLPELAAWVTLEAAMLICVSPLITFHPLNMARVAALSIPALAIALTAGRRPSASTDDAGRDPEVNSEGPPPTGTGVDRALSTADAS